MMLMKYCKYEHDITVTLTTGYKFLAITVIPNLSMYLLIIQRLISLALFQPYEMRHAI